jgi:response regulator RpfG family c-di-GMP phosphodiesterase
MSGLQLLKEVKSASDLRHIPVVVLTASESEIDRTLAFEAQANSYVVKPAKLVQLLKVIDQLQLYWTRCNFTGDSIRERGHGAFRAAPGANEPGMPRVGLAMEPYLAYSPQALS